MERKYQAMILALCLPPEKHEIRCESVKICKECVRHAGKMLERTCCECKKIYEYCVTHYDNYEDFRFINMHDNLMYFLCESCVKEGFKKNYICAICDNNFHTKHLTDIICTQCNVKYKKCATCTYNPFICETCQYY